jgi:KUP system potassium uptake protein
VGVASGFLAVDLAFLVANLLKIVHGGWFPLAVAAGIFLIMTTWHTGRKLVTARLNAAEVPLDRFFEELRARPPLRVPGTAVFMTAHAEGVPPILVHHLRHNKVLHEQVVLLTVVILETPTLGSAAEIDVRRLEAGVFRVIARYGYLERLDVPRSLAAARVHGLDWHEDDTTFYLAQLTLFATDRIGMALWRDRLFIFLSRNARRATNFFHLPPNRVVEIGIQLEL